jgi:methionine biosynthesis protein MetW
MMTDRQIDNLNRADREIISSLIPEGAHVLDLGCGDGGLLAELVGTKHVIGRGVEIDGENIIRALERGLSVCQGDIDNGLADYPDGSYEYVILNQTLQVITRPVAVIREMLRVGKYGIVGFPNFGHLAVRARFFLGGRMPKTQALPFDWHDTPNIRELTIRDFRDLCREEGIRIIREEYYMLGRWRRSPLVNPLANLFAVTGMFVITGSPR